MKIPWLQPSKRRRRAAATFETAWTRAFQWLRYGMVMKNRWFKHWYDCPLDPCTHRGGMP